MTAAYNSDVTLEVSIGFGSGAVPGTPPTFTDVTAYCRQFATRRGRSRVLDQMQAGVATVVFNNEDGRFSPHNTAGAYYPDLIMGTPMRIRATYSAVTYDIFYGSADSWSEQAGPGGKDKVAVVTFIDGFHALANVETSLTESAELSGTRIGNLLDTASWPSGTRDLDAGTHYVQALSSEFDTVLDQIHRTVLVEQGLFYIAGNGDATFRDANTRLEDSTAVQATFSDDGADTGYTSLTIDNDTLQLWNKAVITRSGGSAQTSSDSTSITQYGQQDMHLSETLHRADGEAKALADWIISEYKDQRPRVDAVTVSPTGASWVTALGLDFLDLVNVERTDVTGDVFDDNCFVEGISHTVTALGRKSWTTTFQLSPKLAYSDWWILGTSELGTDTRLAY